MEICKSMLKMVLTMIILTSSSLTVMPMETIKSKDVNSMTVLSLLKMNGEKCIVQSDIQTFLVKPLNGNHVVNVQVLGNVKMSKFSLWTSWLSMTPMSVDPSIQKMLSIVNIIISFLMNVT